MSIASPSDPVSLSLSVAQQVDAVCQRFETACKAAPAAGEMPRIEDYLAEIPESARPTLALEMLQIEVFHRRRLGDQPQPASYQARFPTLDLAWMARVAAPVPDAGQPTSAPAETRPAREDATCWPTLPGFEILGELGRGGMGVVYWAWHQDLKRAVALKMVLAGAHAGPRALARFRIEAEAAARLQHPNIVQVYDVGEHDGCPYLVLEYVDGGNLARRTNGTPQPLRQAAQLTETLARAVHYAHQHGVVHRDLNPANILLSVASCQLSVVRKETVDSSSLTTDNWQLTTTPKIADFGLAKLVVGGAAETQSGEILGTPSYMAPEQVTGQAHAAGPAIDVYALGAILYELLTGRPPFKAATALETVQQIVSAEPVSLTRLQPKVPRDLETICLKCLQKEPARRYASAEALADDLGRFLTNQPIQARRVSAWERGVKWARRRPAVAGLLIALGVALLVLVVGGMAFTVQLRQERDHAQQQEQLAKDQRDYAQQQEQLVKNERDKFRQTLYAAHIHLAHQTWQEAQVGRTLELLDGEGCPSDLRGWEWSYLHGLCHKELRTLQGHTGSVTPGYTGNIPSLAFSPDGRWLASGGWDGTVRLWDITHGQEVHTLRGHQAEVHGVAFRPDGRQLASASNDKTVKLWDPATGREIRSLTDPKQNLVRGVAYSPDGRYLASAGWDKVIRLWNPDQGKVVRTFSGHTAPILSVAFSPDGRQLASAGQDWTIRLWDVATGRLLHVLKGHRGQISCVVFHPTGAALATGSEDETIKLWDTVTGKELENFLKGQHHGWVYNLAFSPDGRRLASASYDRTVKLWDLANGHLLETLRGHTSIVTSVAFSPDGRQLASGSGDQTVKLWDLTASSQEFHPLWGHIEPVGRAVFSPDGRQLAVACRDGTVSVWNVAHRAATLFFREHTDEVWGVAFSPDGRQIASASWDRTIKLWDAASGAVLRTFTGHKGRIKEVAFSPDGRYLASAGTDHRVKLWDVASGEEVRAFTDQRDTCPIFGPGSRWLATVSQDNAVKLWEIPSGQEIGSLEGHTGGVLSLALSPDGRWLASASTDKTIKVWDLRSRRPALTLRGHTGKVLGVTFSPDSHRIATAGYDRTVKLWDVASGQELLTLRGFRSLVYSVAFSPDGRTLATAGVAQAIRLWDAAPDYPIP